MRWESSTFASVGWMKVYVSLPLTGRSAQHGRDVLRGAELALERSGGVEIELLDAPQHEPVFANAERAAADPEAGAYLGDLHSANVAESAPVLGEAGLLQVAPVATWVGLAGNPTLVRLSPDDEMGARAVADWLVE